MLISATGTNAEGSMMPALAMTMSREVMPCLERVVMALVASVLELESIFTIMRRELVATGRLDRDWESAEEGLRTAAMMVVWGRVR